jgi:gliding motility-associated-like protein
LKGRIVITFLASFYCSICSGFDVTIIESQSNNAGQKMDLVWLSIAKSMGYTATLHTQGGLDSLGAFKSTDALIISSGLISFSQARINNIINFIKSGRPVYLQGEYQTTFSGNQAFSEVVNKFGGNFTWGATTAGDLNPMVITGAFSNAKVPISSLPYFWYGCYGTGCGIDYFLTYNNLHYGFAFRPANNIFGVVIQTTDQDWVNSQKGNNLMINILGYMADKSLWSTNPARINIFNNHDTTSCSIITLDARNSGSTYLWSTGATTQKISTKIAGAYWVKVSTSSCSATDTIIFHNSGAKVSLGADTNICKPYMLSAKGQGLAHFKWSTGETSSGILVSKSGTYWVHAYSPDSACDAWDTIKISSAAPAVDLGKTAVLCASKTLDAGNPGATYLWSTGETSEKIIAAQPGTYWVTVHKGLCTASDTIVFKKSALSVNLGPDIKTCDPVLLATAHQDVARWQWSTGETDSQINVLKSGIYWVKVFGIDTACKAFDTVQISIVNLNVNLGKDTEICFSKNLDAGNKGCKYIWSTGDTTEQINVSKNGKYWVTVSNSICKTSDTINLSKKNSNFQVKPDTTICNGDYYFLNLYAPESNYMWDDGSSKPTRFLTKEGTYWVDIFSVCDTVHYNVNLAVKLCNCEPYIPNAFTPNDDPVNKKFIVSVCYATEYELHIYNRWGEHLFVSHDVNTGWDGTFQGQPCIEGVYIYSVLIKQRKDKIYKTGTLHLLR